MPNKIIAIYDKIFKRILTLSKGAIIHFINGIFDKDFPFDSEVMYNWTESVTDKLEKTLADTIMTINKEKFHIEVQISNDETILLRVFDYGYQDARKYKVVSAGRIRLEFPTSKIIYLEHNKATPDEVILELDFKEQGIFEYKVPTMKFLTYSIEDLSDSHMVIMLPLYLLKLRKQIARSKSRENAMVLKALIDNILKTIERNEEAGNLTHEDVIVLTDLLKLLYDDLYGDVKEFEEEGVGNMIAERLTTYTEEVALERAATIAKRMLKRNMDIDEIAELTELPIEQIKELQENIQQNYTS